MRESLYTAADTVLAGSPLKVFVLWDDVLLTLVNCPSGLSKLLTFQVKSLQQVGWERKSVRETVECFKTTNVKGLLVLKTLQGFWQRAVLWLIKNGYAFELIDLRKKDLLPLPELGRAHGFRFSQEEFFKTGLSFNCSGCFEATTRYGKSTIARNIMNVWPKANTLFVIPGKDLLGQAQDELKAAMPHRDVKKIGGGSRTRYQGEDITICSADSLHRIDPGPIRLMVIDEPHALVAPSRIVHVPKFHLARKYALGATLFNRYDKRDFLLEGLVGPVLSSRPYKAARAEGAVSKIVAVMVRWELPPQRGDRDTAYKSLMFLNEDFGKFVQKLSNLVIPADWQTLIFIKTEEQADFLQDRIGRDISVAMAKKLSDSARKILTDRIRDAHINRALCSDIFVQGVTFHYLMALINASGGGASTSTIQKPGRLAEYFPDKTAGYLFDFEFVLRGDGAVNQREVPEGVRCMIADSKARLAAYREIGYDVHQLRPEEVEPWFAAQDARAPKQTRH